MKKKLKGKLIWNDYHDYHNYMFVEALAFIINQTAIYMTENFMCKYHIMYCRYLVDYDKRDFRVCDCNLKHCVVFR